MKVSAMAKLNLPPCPMPQKKVYECSCNDDTPRLLLMIPNILLYATLAAPFINLSSVPMAIGSWCGNYWPGLSRSLQSIRRSGGIYSFSSIFFKVLMVSSYLLGMVLFCCRKRTRPRGHERAIHPII